MRYLKIYPNKIEEVDEFTPDSYHAVLVSPHYDDLEYSCFSLMTNFNAQEFICLYLTYGEHQSIRLEQYVELSRILGKCIRVIDAQVFKDGDGSITDIRKVISVFDKYFVNCSFIAIPEPSHHQDHKLIYDAALASLRYRDALRKDLMVIAYNYVYNHELIEPNIYVELSESSFKGKIEFLEILDLVDNILVNKVNNIRTIEALAISNGSKIGVDYAESFRLIRMGLPNE